MMEAYDHSVDRDRNVVASPRTSRSVHGEHPMVGRHPNICELMFDVGAPDALVPTTLGRRSRVELVELDALEAVCACLPPHIQDGEAQRFCLSALVTMSLGGGEGDHLDAMRCDALARIAMSGGVEATVHALQAHFEQKHGKVVLGKSNLLSKFG
jgi:hypothetical protein